METVLVTGATGFLGYHVVRRLNAAGIRPRVLELRDAPTSVLDRLQVVPSAGSLDDAAAVRAACGSVDTLLHLAFKVSVGGGAALVDDMRRINVDGTRQLLDIASASGVRRAVVTGSALAVGVNKQPVPIDEAADWQQHRFDLQYANIRREAELDALSRTSVGFDVMSVCPALTFGPDDPVGAPGNKLVQAVVAGKLPFTLPVGFGCLDVRDFAAGMVLAAERGRPGQRYLLSGENVTTNQLLEETASLAGARRPWFTPPIFVVRALVGVLEIASAIRRKPTPITREVLQIVGRYAWYDTTKARTELGWSSRPLRETLEDTIRWLRESSPGATANTQTR